MMSAGIQGSGSHYQRWLSTSYIKFQVSISTSECWEKLAEKLLTLVAIREAII